MEDRAPLLGLVARSARRARSCGRRVRLTARFSSRSSPFGNPAHGDAPSPFRTLRSERAPGDVLDRPISRELERRTGTRRSRSRPRSRARAALKQWQGDSHEGRPDVLLDVERAGRSSRAVRARANDGTACGDSASYATVALRKVPVTPAFPCATASSGRGAQIEQRVEARDERSGRRPADGENTQAQRDLRAGPDTEAEARSSVSLSSGDDESFGRPAGGTGSVRPSNARNRAVPSAAKRPARTRPVAKVSAKRPSVEVVVLAELQAHHVSAAQPRRACSIDARSWWNAPRGVAERIGSASCTRSGAASGTATSEDRETRSKPSYADARSALPVASVPIRHSARGVRGGAAPPKRRDRARSRPAPRRVPKPASAGPSRPRTRSPAPRRGGTAPRSRHRRGGAEPRPRACASARVTAGRGPWSTPVGRATSNGVPPGTLRARSPGRSHRRATRPARSASRQPPRQPRTGRRGRQEGRGRPRPPVQHVDVAPEGAPGVPGAEREDRGAGCSVRRARLQHERVARGVTRGGRTGGTRARCARSVRR